MWCALYVWMLITSYRIMYTQSGRINVIFLRYN